MGCRSRGNNLCQNGLHTLQGLLQPQPLAAQSLWEPASRHLYRRADCSWTYAYECSQHKGAPLPLACLDATVRCSWARAHCRHQKLGNESQAAASHSVTGVLSPEEVNTRLDFTPQLSKLQVSTGLCSVPQHGACRTAQHKRPGPGAWREASLLQIASYQAAMLCSALMSYGLQPVRLDSVLSCSATRRAVLRRAGPAGCC